MPPNLIFAETSKKSSYVTRTTSASYEVQNLKSWFSVVRDHQTQFKQLNLFPNSVSFMIFHNQFISSPAGRRMINISLTFSGNFHPNPGKGSVLEPLRAHSNHPQTPSFIWHAFSVWKGLPISNTGMNFWDSFEGVSLKCQARRLKNL